MSMDIERFDPGVEQLQKLITRTSDVTATDLTDRKQIEAIREARIELKNVRVKITKTGKELRDDALKFQRAVIAKEKELVGMIEPEEKRLAGIEDQAKELKLIEERKELLPDRHNRLNDIGDGIKATDDELLAMDGPTFEGYVNERQAAQLEKVREAQEAKEQAEREDKDRQRREQEMKEREERVRQQERERLEREQKEKAEREQREAEKEKAREQEEKLRLEREQKYQQWLSDNGYTEQEGHLYYFVTSGNVVKM